MNPFEKAWSCRIAASVLLFGLAMSSGSIAQSGTSSPANIREKTYAMRGIVREVPGDGTIVIQHEAVSNYMAAMTMPFHVRREESLTGIRPGDTLDFQLHVTDEASWVGGIVDRGAGTPPPAARPAVETASAPVASPLWDYCFTNELGRPVSLKSFRGQALAITFFYTSCPLPDYCPRLSKNFQVASRRLGGMPNAPTNWHFLSITFDPKTDDPARLKAYALSYGYDPDRWSFLTGPPEKIAELARSAGVSYDAESGVLNHNFRTLIVDPDGGLQTVFPTSGDLSDQILGEMVKAMASYVNQPIHKAVAAISPSPVPK